MWKEPKGAARVGDVCKTKETAVRNRLSGIHSENNQPLCDLVCYPEVGDGRSGSSA